MLIPLQHCFTLGDDITAMTTTARTRNTPATTRAATRAATLTGSPPSDGVPTSVVSVGDGAELLDGVPCSVPVCAPVSVRCGETVVTLLGLEAIAWSSIEVGLPSIVLSMVTELEASAMGVVTVGNMAVLEVGSNMVLNRSPSIVSDAVTSSLTVCVAEHEI